MHPFSDPATLSAQPALAQAEESSATAAPPGTTTEPRGAVTAPSPAGHPRILLLVSALLVGDAVLILANVRAAPDWLAFVECLVAAVLGLRVFRQLAEAAPDTQAAAPIPATAPVPAAEMQPGAPHPASTTRAA
jgi:hypothetical protein